MQLALRLWILRKPCQAVPYIVWEESGGAKQQQNEVRVCEIVSDQYLQMYNSKSTMQEIGDAAWRQILDDSGKILQLCHA